MLCFLILIILISFWSLIMRFHKIAHTCTTISNLSYLYFQNVCLNKKYFGNYIEILVFLFITKHQKKKVKYKKYTLLSLIFSIGNFVIISAKLILKICHLYSIDTDMLCVNRVIFCFFPLCNTLLLALSNQWVAFN